MLIIFYFDRFNDDFGTYIDVAISNSIKLIA